MDISYGDVFERDRIELNLIIKENNDMCLGTFSWMSFFMKKCGFETYLCWVSYFQTNSIDPCFESTRWGLTMQIRGGKHFWHIIYQMKLVTSDWKVAVDCQW